MKTLLCAIFAGCSCLAQNHLMFIASNRNSRVNAPVLNFDGLPLSGSQYLALVYGGSTPDSLSPVLDINRAPLTPIPFGTGDDAGYFRNLTGYVRAPAVSNIDPHSWIEVRAWDSDLGITYEEAVAKGIGGYGRSPVFLATGRWDDEIASVPQALEGLESFSISAVVPEPETWALWGAGLAALGWHYRRRAR